MLKNKILPIALIIFIPFSTVFAAELDNLKAEFLRGHYNNVIVEGRAKTDKVSASSVDELNYLVGLSLLKENRFEESQVYFNKVLASSSDKFKERVRLALKVKSPQSPKVEGEYSVQVGFFSSSDNADKLKDKLQSMDYPAYVEAFGSGYRVRVGKFKTLKEAQELESKLSQDDFQTKLCP